MGLTVRYGAVGVGVGVNSALQCGGLFQVEVGDIETIHQTNSHPHQVRHVRGRVWGDVLHQHPSVGSRRNFLRASRRRTVVMLCRMRRCG